MCVAQGWKRCIISFTIVPQYASSSGLLKRPWEGPDPSCPCVRKNQTELRFHFTNWIWMGEMRLAITHTDTNRHRNESALLLPACPSVHLPCKALVCRHPHEAQRWSPPDSSWWHRTADTCCPEATHFYGVGTQRCTMFNQMLPYPHLNHQSCRVPSSRSLHDGCEKRLWVKEPG